VLKVGSVTSIEIVPGKSYIWKTLPAPTRVKSPGPSSPKSRENDMKTVTEYTKIKLTSKDETVKGAITMVLAGAKNLAIVGKREVTSQDLIDSARNQIKQLWNAAKEVAEHGGVNIKQMTEIGATREVFFPNILTVPDTNQALVSYTTAENIPLVMSSRKQIEAALVSDESLDWMAVTEWLNTNLQKPTKK
jgi:uncharacterized protein YqeY